MRSRIVPILRPWSWAKANRSSIRAMLPSSRHDLADHARRVQPGEAGDVDRRLGMAGADEHAAVARDQREDVARRDDMLGALAGVDRDRDRAGAVGGGDAGGDALARLDRGGEGGFEAGAVGAAHRLQAELVDPLAGQRQADQAAAVLGHEVDRVGRRHLRRDDEVALILAVLVVDQDEHAAVARLVDDLLGARHHSARAAGEEFLELDQSVGGRVPVLVAELAQAVGMEAGGAGEAGAAHLAGGDEVAEAVDQDGAHAGRVSHCNVIRQAEFTSGWPEPQASARDSAPKCRSRC